MRNPFAEIYQQYRMTRDVPGPRAIMPRHLWHDPLRGRQMTYEDHYGPLMPLQEPGRKLKAPNSRRDGVTPGGSARQSRRLRNREASGIVTPVGVPGNPLSRGYAQLRAPRWQEGYYGYVSERPGREDALLD